MARRAQRAALFAQDQAAILDALNQAVSRLYVYESQEPGGAGATA